MAIYKFMGNLVIKVASTNPRIRESTKIPEKCVRDDYHGSFHQSISSFHARFNTIMIGGSQLGSVKDPIASSTRSV
jgi:hypothetical protein